MGFTYKESGVEIRRRFVPSDDPGRSSIALNNLVVYNPQKEISSLTFKAHSSTMPAFRDDFSLVVYVDGACRNNGFPMARASYGIFFGPDSKYNFSRRLPATMPQPSTRAEIEGFVAALDAVRKICETDFMLSHVIIATDSSYLVNAMALHVEGWIARNGLGSRDAVLAHYERLKELHGLLDEMEYGDCGGIEVQFPHIVRGMNQQADALANTALDV